MERIVIKDSQGQKMIQKIKEKFKQYKSKRGYESLKALALEYKKELNYNDLLIISNMSKEMEANYSKVYARYFEKLCDDFLSEHRKLGLDLRKMLNPNMDVTCNHCKPKGKILNVKMINSCNCGASFLWFLTHEHIRNKKDWYGICL